MARPIVGFRPPQQRQGGAGLSQGLSALANIAGIGAGIATGGVAGAAMAAGGGAGLLNTLGGQKQTMVEPEPTGVPNAMDRRQASLEAESPYANLFALREAALSIPKLPEQLVSESKPILDALQIEIQNIHKQRLKQYGVV